MDGASKSTRPSDLLALWVRDGEDMSGSIKSHIVQDTLGHLGEYHRNGKPTVVGVVRPMFPDAMKCTCGATLRNILDWQLHTYGSGTCIVGVRHAERCAL